MNTSDHVAIYTQSFVQGLVDSGLDTVVISPGSRSTPLAIAFHRHSQIHTFVHVDERSAGFFALGIAKARKKPVALLCTSGTAAANYFPSIIEANYSRIPLLVLTADRPHELREVGAPQAIDQINLYGNHVKYFQEMAIPESHLENYCISSASRAYNYSNTNPKGPIHLNFPFREPLMPNDYIHQTEKKTPMVLPSTHRMSEESLHLIHSQLKDKTRGIIVCGDLGIGDAQHIIVEFAKKLNFPILADPLSQLRQQRYKDSVIRQYEIFLRSEKIQQQLHPDVVIRFGAYPTSKALQQFLAKSQSDIHIVVDAGEGYRDPHYLATHHINVDETAFCQQLLEILEEEKDDKDNTDNKDNTDYTYLTLWKSYQKTAVEELTKRKTLNVVSELDAFLHLEKLLPQKAQVVIGNSMPIRDLDLFFDSTNKDITFYANRGANGIDGVISTALGIATNNIPTYLLIGDVSFFHDAMSLQLAKQYKIPLTILLINNNGGGIFSFLPQADLKNDFETLFGTPLDVPFQPLVGMFGGSYRVVTQWSDIQKTSNVLSVYEVQSERRENREIHRELINSIIQVLETKGGLNETS